MAPAARCAPSKARCGSRRKTSRATSSSSRAPATACASADSPSSMRSAAPPPCPSPDKGNAMKLTYEALLNDPSLLDRLHVQAQRDRAEAMHRLIVEPITDLFRSHAARPHLARQG